MNENLPDVKINGAGDMERTQNVIVSGDDYLWVMSLFMTALGIMKALARKLAHRAMDLHVSGCYTTGIYL